VKIFVLCYYVKVDAFFMLVYCARKSRISTLEYQWLRNKVVATKIGLKNLQLSGSTNHLYLLIYFSVIIMWSSIYFVLLSVCPSFFRDGDGKKQEKILLLIIIIIGYVMKYVKGTISRRHLWTGMIASLLVLRKQFFLFNCKLLSISVAIVCF
jgi:hypothetical protein